MDGTYSRDIDLLVVDDDDDFRSTLIGRFERAGFAVHGAACGEDAWKLIQRHDFHVAVLDMMLPACRF